MEEDTDRDDVFEGGPSEEWINAEEERDRNLFRNRKKKR
jgi:hypothetical protein